MKKTMKLASRSRRFVAGLIDKAVPFIIGIALSNAVKGLVSYTASNLYYGYYGYYTTPSYGTVGQYGFPIVGCVLACLAYGIVEIIFYTRSQSIGKAIMGLKVVSSVNGAPLSIGKMLFREFLVKPASAAVLYLGYIWILIDDKNRGWHDKILDTFVIDIHETSKIESL